MTGRPRWSAINGYVVAVTATGSSILLVLAIRGGVRSLAHMSAIFWLCWLFMVVGEIRYIVLPRSGNLESITTTTCLSLAMLLGWGLAPTALGLAASSIASDIFHRKAAKKAAFNAAQYAIAVTAGGSVLLALGVRPPFQVSQLPAFFVAAAIYLLVNKSLVGIVVALHQQAPLDLRLWRGSGVELLPKAIMVAMAPLVLVVAQRLQESERLKENLLAAVSHELRTPLAGVLGAIATLDQRGHLLTPQLQGEFIAMAARQGRRLRELIEDLLLAATLEQVPSERLPAPPVDVSDLARQACEVARRADPTQPIVVSLDGSLPVRAAPDAVLQVLTNLLDNATRHSPEGVAIRLEARPQGAHALIAIQDGGPGVPLAERERIFERFIRLDEEGSSRRGGGVGLGLYVARRLARAQGGDLRVAEPVGVEGGARFELLLPLAGEPEPAADLGPVGLLPAREVAREVVGQGQQAGQASVGEALPPAAQA